MAEKMEITWEKLVELEPELELLRQRIADNPTASWYGKGKENGGYKQEMLELVGFMRRDVSIPLLNTTRAYEVAYQKLCNYDSNCIAGVERNVTFKVSVPRGLHEHEINVIAGRILSMLYSMYPKVDGVNVDIQDVEK